MAMLSKIKASVQATLGQYRGLRREIYILCIARIVNGVGSFVYPQMALILTDKIGFAESEAGLFSTLLLLVQAPVMLLGGKLADKFGRLKLIVIFQFCGAAAYIVCGLMQPSYGMVITIAIASCMYAITYPALDAMSADLTQSGQRKKALALLYMGFNLGYVVGPALGGFFYENYLHWIFIGNALATIVSTVLLCVFIRETLPQKQAQVAAAEPELEHEVKGSIWRVLMQRKVLLVFAFVMLLFQFAYSQWAFSLPLQIKAQMPEIGARAYGGLASYNGLLVIIFTPIIALLIKRWRVMAGTAVGGLLYAAAFFMLIFIRALPLYYISMTVLTLGEIVMTIDSQAFVADYSPSSHRGRLNSVVNSISNIGRVISPMVVGFIVASHNLAAGWWTVSLTALTGGVLLVAILRSGMFKAHKVGEVQAAETAVAVEVMNDAP